MRLPVLTTLCLGLVTAPALLAAPADDCGAVVETTIEEMRVAAGPSWDAGQEALARRAAAAACVKVRSGRYDALSSEVVGTRTGEAQAAAMAPAGEAKEAEKAEKSQQAENDEGLWPFGEFKINDVSASPSKKPYERRRLDNDD
jgi:hypothetical protein